MSLEQVLIRSLGASKECYCTFNTALAATAPAVAVMAVEPVAIAVVNPETEMVATDGLLDAQIFILEMSNDGLIEHVAVAV